MSRVAAAAKETSSQVSRQTEYVNSDVTVMAKSTIGRWESRKTADENYCYYRLLQDHGFYCMAAAGGRQSNCSVTRTSYSAHIFQFLTQNKNYYYNYKKLLQKRINGERL